MISRIYILSIDRWELFKYVILSLISNSHRVGDIYTHTHTHTFDHSPVMQINHEINQTRPFSSVGVYYYFYSKNRKNIIACVVYSDLSYENCVGLIP